VSLDFRSSHSHHIGISDNRKLKSTNVRWSLQWCLDQVSWRFIKWFKSFRWEHNMDMFIPSACLSLWNKENR
jgi:hypothetical protein